MHRAVERGRSHQSALLADREHQLDAGVGAARRARACGPSPGSPRRRPCCRRRRSRGWRFAARRRRARARASAVAARCRGGRTETAGGRWSSAGIVADTGCRSRCRPSRRRCQTRTVQAQRLELGRYGLRRRHARNCSGWGSPRAHRRGSLSRAASDESSVRSSAAVTVITPPFPRERRFSSAILTVGGSKSKRT